LALRIVAAGPASSRSPGCERPLRACRVLRQTTSAVTHSSCCYLRCPRLEPQLLIIVAAEGGGIRAAYWTAGILTRLVDCPPALADSLFAISAVSGGSLGAAVYVSLRAVPRVADAARGLSGPDRSRACSSPIYRSASCRWASPTASATSNKRGGWLGVITPRRGRWAPTASARVVRLWGTDDLGRCLIAAASLASPSPG
jgi:hypothetical protein